MYMAPELAQGSRYAQPAADMFSLGVIAFEVLTGSIPFERPPVLDLPPRAQNIVPLLSRCPSLSPTLAKLFERCLSFDPAKRPSASDAASLLAEVPASTQSAPRPPV